MFYSRLLAFKMKTPPHPSYLLRCDVLTSLPPPPLIDFVFTEYLMSGSVRYMCSVLTPTCTSSTSCIPRRSRANMARVHI